MKTNVDIIFITGNHPRHIYFANKIVKNFDNSFIAIQEREPHSLKPGDFYNANSLNKEEKRLWNLHFDGRRDAENLWFGQSELLKNSLTVKPKELYEDKYLNDFKKLNPKILLSYGCGLIGKHTSRVASIANLNFHGGLSPWYKGTATHFWPSYFLEPEFTGVAIHELYAKIDAGPLVHQVGGDLVLGDGVHELSSRTVHKAIDECIDLLKNILNKETYSSTPQTKTGKLFVNKDWNVGHLKLIYELFENRVVDWRLNESKPKELSLYRDNLN